jgi:hypothetical protein
MQAMMKSTFDTPKNMFNHVEVGLSESMHEQASLLHSIDDIWSGECEILSRTGKTTINCGIW